MQKILNTHLIITLERFYIDKQNNPNAYMNTNPSLWIGEDGMMVVLVRQINYRKYANKTFYVGENKSKSKYLAMSQKATSVNDLKGMDFDSLTSYAVEYDWGDFKKHDTYWEGMEDVRFINDNELLVTVAERNDGGMPCQFLAHLEFKDYYYSIKLIERLEPHEVEKNWMPFDDSKVIISLNPFIIQDLDNNGWVTTGARVNNQQEINIDDNIKKLLVGYEGSSNGIMMDDYYLFLIHNNTSKTKHCWLKMNCYDLTVRISEPFCFYQHSFTEMTCSLVFYNNLYYVALGVDECKAMIVTISPTDIDI